MLSFLDDATGPNGKGGETNLEQELNPIISKQDSIKELHKAPTALPPSFNHQLNLKDLLLHEALLTKNFEGDQKFFRDGGHLEGHPAFPSPSYIEPGDPLGATHLVPHEDAPAFSDIATTVMTTASPTSPRRLVFKGQNRPNKGRIGGKVEVLGGQVVTAASLLGTGQQRASPKTEQSPRVDYTKKDHQPAGKSIMGNPTDMDRDTTSTSIIHTTTVISTMTEQGMYISMRCSILSFSCSFLCFLHDTWVSPGSLIFLPLPTGIWLDWLHGIAHKPE